MHAENTQRWPWLPLLAAGAALVLSAFLISGTPNSVPSPLAAQGGAAAEDAAPEKLGAPRTRRCPECGWIESRRAIDITGAKGDSVRLHEFTVRMGDGSSRVFQEERADAWRLGERLMVIDP